MYGSKILGKWQDVLLADWLNIVTKINKPLISDFISGILLHDVRT